MENVLIIDGPGASTSRSLLSKVEFIKRFTPTEYAAIKTAASVNASVDYYWQLLMVAEYVNLKDTTTIDGVTALETGGLIAAGRATQILS